MVTSTITFRGVETMKKLLKRLLVGFLAVAVVAVGLLTAFEVYMTNARAPGGWLRVDAESTYLQEFGRAASDMSQHERKVAFLQWQYNRMDRPANPVWALEWSNNAENPELSRRWMESYGGQGR